MIADVDYDIFSHLGFVQNVDLDQKGVYVIQVSLFCGDGGTKIAPVGLFSAPNALDSFVEEHKVCSRFVDFSLLLLNSSSAIFCCSEHYL